MDAKGKSVLNRSYQDLQPQSNWAADEVSNTLLVDLPGFNKEQLRVQIDTLGNLKISGERPLASNNWIRFRKDIGIPENSNLSNIRAKFEKGVLHVIVPKKIATITRPTPPTQKPAAAAQQQPPKEEQKLKETVDQITTTEKQSKEKKTKDSKESSVGNGDKEASSSKQKMAAEIPSPGAENNGNEKVEERKEKEKDAVRSGEACKLTAHPRRGRAGMGGKKLVAVAAVVVAVGLGVYVFYRFQTMHKEES